MKIISKLVTLIFSVFFSLSICYVYSSNVIFNDNFSTPDHWQFQGNGDVNVSGGKCNFNNVYCGSYNRIYNNIGITLSDDYWRSECNFSILNTNPTGLGTGEVVMAITAGTLDFMSYDSTQYYNETNQDGVAVILLSNSSMDNNINNWYFIIEGKKGLIRNFDLSSVIYADSSITSYFIRLERAEKGKVILSIFSDSTFTNHLSGSPVEFQIDPTITGLNTIQHGTITPGFYTRFINATVDDDFIFDEAFNTGFPPLEMNGNTILIYPNPSNAIITIKSSEEFLNSCYYLIYDTKGVELVSSFLEPSKQIDISQLPFGVYLITICDTKKTYQAKFQKVY